MAAPSATTSSGFNPLCGVRWKSSSHQLADLRDARRAAYQHGFVDLLWGQPGIFHRLPDRPNRAIDDRLDQLLKLRARDLALIAFAAGKLYVQRRLFVRRQSNFGVDHRLANRLHDLGVAADVDRQIALDVVQRDGDQQVVDVVATEVSVAVSGDHLEDALVQLENRDVESAAAQVVNRNRFGVLLVETVGQRCRRRFIHQAQDFEARDAAGVFGGLPLRIVEVRRDRDDSLGDRRREVALGIALQLAQDESRNFRRGEGLVAELDAQHFAGGEIVSQPEREELQLVLHILDAAAHEALDAVHGALRRLDQILARGAAHNDLAVLVQRDDRRHQVQSVFAGDHDRTVAFHVGHQRVGGAQIDSDDAFVWHG